MTTRRISIPQENLSKTDEVALLKDIAEAFGPNSYIGPWLSSVVEEVESDIRNDFPPVPSARATRELVEAMKADAATQSRLVLERAHLESNRIREEARLYAERLREAARSSLRRALQEV